MNSILFAQPYFLYLLLLVPVVLFVYWYRYRQGWGTFKVASLLGATKTKSVKVRLRNIPIVLRLLCLTLIIVALARPQTQYSEDKIKTEGIDILLAMDISGSMLAMDFEPNRLEAAKNTAIQFVNERQNDRIGVVLFSGESFTQMPLTSDKTQLIQSISQISNTGILEQGTALGMGLANSVARLEESKAKSKVVILLTDGVNNAGSIDPVTATQTAKEFGIKVYTIGVGTYGEAKMPINTMFGVQYAMQKVEIDEDLMKQIANETGGQYFRATDDKKLQDIYKEINKLEKTSLEINTKKQFKEEFYVWALFALILLIIEIVVRKTFFHTINE